MNRNFSEDEHWMAGYLMGDLSEEQRARVEARMAADPAFARQIEAHRQMEDLLRKTQAPEVPEGLNARILAALPPAPDSLDPVLERQIRFHRRVDLGALILSIISLLTFLFPTLSGIALQGLETTGVFREIHSFIRDIARESGNHQALFLVMFLLSLLFYLGEHSFLRYRLSLLEDRENPNPPSPSAG